MSILRRRLADRWRRRTIPCVTTGSFTPEAAVTDPDPMHHGFADEVQQALDRLPAKLREALLLVVVGELTHQEAADELGVPLGTVLSRVSRARRQLRDLLLNNPAVTGRTAEGEPATVPLKGQPKQRSGGA
jgi:RNA polymerase sigma-70 factor (ECF subfamily)